MSLTRLPLSTPVLALALVLCFAPGAQADDITITGTINASVWGNGTQPNGNPSPSPPTSAINSSVTVNNGGTVPAPYTVYCAFALSQVSSSASSTDSHVTVNNGGTVYTAIGGFA